MENTVWSSECVTVHMAQGTAVVTLNRPPVNALSHQFRAEIAGAITAAAKVATGLILTGHNNSFVAGAEISELGQTQSPTLRDLIADLVALPIPTVAAIDGPALGGGLELALGCRMRVATDRSRLGFPEVALGILPGAGGTVRATHLVGALNAAEMIATGKPVSAAEALTMGLIDHVVPGNVVDAAIALIHSAPTRPEPTPFDAYAYDKASKSLLAKAKGQAMQRCIDAVRTAATEPFDVAMAHERQLFVQACATPESRALRHLFFAERAAAKVDGLDLTLARPLNTIGVIGAGTMGRGIAMACADAGLTVRLREVNEAALTAGLAAIAAQYQASVAKNRLTTAEAATLTARIIGTLNVADLTDCDLVIEAAFEDIAVKRSLFTELDAALGPDMILATNTSYLDVDQIAAMVRRPERVLGLHFFSPANVMKLLEIVRADRTDDATLATGLALSRRMKKISVTVGVCRGFVGNRMLQARNAQLSALLLEGARPAQVDAAFRGFGWPMGPFEMQDMAGLDISWRMRKGLGLTDALPDALCEAGRLGQKVGQGWYRYDPGARSPVDDPAVAQIITALATTQGITPREVSTPEILDRTHGPMVDEGRKILAEGIAARSSDIDVVWVNGYGFPRHLGGPMFWSDTVDKG